LGLATSAALIGTSSGSATAFDAGFGLFDGAVGAGLTGSGADPPQPGRLRAIVTIKLNWNRTGKVLITNMEYLSFGDIGNRNERAKRTSTWTGNASDRPDNVRYRMELRAITHDIKSIDGIKLWAVK
jgi:hypothetical protein